MNHIRFYKLLNYAAIAGNILFVLWILVNGIDEGFKATPAQIASYIGLLILLALNTALLLRKAETG